MEHTLLEHDPESGYALAFTTRQSPMPYVVAYGYDPDAGDWKQGHYHLSIETAVVDYKRCIGQPNVELVPDDCFCTIRWRDKDIEQFIAQTYGKRFATKRNVKTCKLMMGGGEVLLERSNEAIRKTIEACLDSRTIPDWLNDGL